MASILFTDSSLTTEPDNLTLLHQQSGLPTNHTSRRTQGGFLVGGPRLLNFIPTPVDIKRPLHSWVWKEGHAITRLSPNGVSENFWLCERCYNSPTNCPEKQYLKPAAPTNLTQRHLSKHHGFNLDGTRAMGSRKRPHNDIRGLFDEQEQATKRVFNLAGWQDVYTSWVATSGISLRQAVAPAFRRLLTYQNPRMESVLPLSASTAATWIQSAYERHQVTIIESLANATSGVTISFDGWKANNDVLDLLGIVAHYLDQDHRLRVVVLALCNTYGSHAGANIADNLFEVLGTYKIRSKVTFFAADNATNNDKAISLLSREILHYDPQQMRLRCAGHILNLVCKAILYGVDEDCVAETLLSLENNTHDYTAVTTFEDTLHTANEQAKLLAWRKKGPIGRLHNLICHIKENNTRMGIFEAKQRELLPDAHGVYRAVINGGIRWNSAYDMVHRSLKLKDSLTLYQEHFHDDGVEPLSYDDWQELTYLHELLEPIHECSLNVQSTSTDGGHGALHEVLTTMDFLLEHLEQAKQRLAHPKIITHFKAMVNLGWKKLDYYYTLTDVTPAYLLSIFLHPHYKYRWFERHWGSRPSWLKRAKDQIHEAYETAKREHSDDLPPRSSPIAVRKISRFAAFNHLDDDVSDDGDELQQYWHEKRPNSDTEPLQWWRDNHHRYPILRHLAFSLLAAPASTAACERLFSCAGNVVDEQRPHTQQQLAQAVQCVRSWEQQGLIRHH
jgi:hypothetical protein